MPQSKIAALLRTKDNDKEVKFTDRSKAVVQVYFLFCVALCFLLQSVSCCLYLARCSRVSFFFFFFGFFFGFLFFCCFFSVLFSIVISSLGKEGWSICFSYICLYVLQVLLSFFCLFPFAPGVGCGLWFVVALGRGFTAQSTAKVMSSRSITY